MLELNYVHFCLILQQVCLLGLGLGLGFYKKDVKEWLSDFMIYKGL